MNTRRIMALGAVILAILLFSYFCRKYWEMPLPNDVQGPKIVRIIEHEFELPAGSSPQSSALYSDARNYFRKGKWHFGSTIAFYGITDSAEQDRFVARIRGMADALLFADIWVEFFPPLEWKTDGKTSVTIDSDAIRSERIRVAVFDADEQAGRFERLKAESAGKGDLYPAGSPAVRIVSEFNADSATVGDLLEVIQTAAEEGAARVKFLEGEWHWHAPGQLELPRKDQFAMGTFQAGAEVEEKALREQIGQWIRMNVVKGGIISMDPKLPARRFFEVERILRREKVAYWVVAAEKMAPGVVQLHETDGLARVMPSGDRLPEVPRE